MTGVADMERRGITCNWDFFVVLATRGTTFCLTVLCRTCITKAAKNTKLYRNPIEFYDASLGNRCDGRMHKSLSTSCVAYETEGISVQLHPTVSA